MIKYKDYDYLYCYNYLNTIVIWNFYFILFFKIYIQYWNMISNRSKYYCTTLYKTFVRNQVEIDEWFVYIVSWLAPYAA